MTLNRLKFVAIIVPIVAVVVLEVVRYHVMGPVPVVKRVLLDVVSVGGIIVFATLIFRFIEGVQNRLHRQNEELIALHAAGLAISADLSPDSVLRKVVDQARDLVGAKYGALSVITANGRIDQFITSGISPEERAAIGPPPVGHGVLGIVLREGKLLRLDDVGSHPKSHGFPPNHPVMRTLLAVPVPCKGPFAGNLYLSEKNDGSRFSQSDQDTLERFAVQAAIAIDNAHLHAQAADLAVAQERLRIAHEMHDGLAQVLGYVNIKVQAAEMYLQRGKTTEATGQLQELAVSARQAYTDVREGIIGLRALPSGDHNLGDVLAEYLDRWKEQSKIGTELVLDPDVHLRPTVELQLVRIIQEALTNVRKHSRAATVRVEVQRRDGKVAAAIVDDGIGFETGSRHRGEFPQFGLSTMRERAESVGGTLEVDSTPGKGTAIRFEMPLPQDAT